MEENFRKQSDFLRSACSFFGAAGVPLNRLPLIPEQIWKMKEGCHDPV